MTCIVGIVDKLNKTVTIAGDSAGVKGLDVVVRKDPKVFHNGDFLFGCTESFRMMQLLRFSFVPPTIPEGKDIYHYMCTDFIDAVRECFRVGGYMEHFMEGGEKGGEFMVGYKDRLFLIYNDFQVGESARGYDALGCGEEYALGTLFVVHQDSVTTRKKAIKALKSAAFFSAGVCEPFIVLST